MIDSRLDNTDQSVSTTWFSTSTLLCFSCYISLNCFMWPFIFNFFGSIYLHSRQLTRTVFERGYRILAWIGKLYRQDQLIAIGLQQNRAGDISGWWQWWDAATLVITCYESFKVSSADQSIDLLFVDFINKIKPLKTLKMLSRVVTTTLALDTVILMIPSIIYILNVHTDWRNPIY
jgi:hypothetical protein